MDSRNLHERAASRAARGKSNFSRLGPALLLASVLSSAGAALADEREDRMMRQLASGSGCSLCHREEARKPGVDELLPNAPSWSDVARRYRGRSDAEDRLTGVVISGSGKEAKDRHWAGKVRDASMPSNLIEISPDDARKLVRWILSRK